MFCPWSEQFLGKDLVINWPAHSDQCLKVCGQLEESKLSPKGSQHIGYIVPGLFSNLPFQLFPWGSFPWRHAKSGRQGVWKPKTDSSFAALKLYLYLLSCDMILLILQIKFCICPVFKNKVCGFNNAWTVYLEKWCYSCFQVFIIGDISQQDYFPPACF